MDDGGITEDAGIYHVTRKGRRLYVAECRQPASARDVADTAGAREREVIGEKLPGPLDVAALDRGGPRILQAPKLVGQDRPLSTNRRTAAWGSSVAIESASQSRAWLIVSCQARSFQKFRCCFV